MGVADARRRAATVSADTAPARDGCVLARREVGGLCVGRIGSRRNQRAAPPGRRTQTAGLQRRGQLSRRRRDGLEFGAPTTLFPLQTGLHSIAIGSHVCPYDVAPDGNTLPLALAGGRGGSAGDHGRNQMGSRYAIAIERTSRNAVRSWQTPSGLFEC
jgi:hypothetical protein